MDTEEITQLLDKLDIADFEAKIMRKNHSERVTQGSGGPQGVGDPSDKSLDSYEKEMLIPQRTFDTARLNYCSEFK